jgi:hypothetical protein
MTVKELRDILNKVNDPMELDAIVLCADVDSNSELEINSVEFSAGYYLVSKEKFLVCRMLNLDRDQEPYEKTQAQT